MTIEASVQLCSDVSLQPAITLYLLYCLSVVHPKLVDECTSVGIYLLCLELTVLYFIISTAYSHIQCHTTESALCALHFPYFYKMPSPRFFLYHPREQTLAD